MTISVDNKVETEVKVAAGRILTREELSSQGWEYSTNFGNYTVFRHSNCLAYTNDLRDGRFQVKMISPHYN